MIKKISLGLGAVGIVFAVCGTASAATATVDVSANIVGTCKFISTPTLGFGALDQTASADATATGDLQFWCTKNTAYTLGDATNPGTGDGAYSGTIASGTDTIPYNISYDNYTGSGAGKTAPVTSTLTGTILNANYVDAPAGTYSGSVVFTIAP